MEVNIKEIDKHLSEVKSSEPKNYSVNDSQRTQEGQFEFVLHR